MDFSIKIKKIVTFISFILIILLSSCKKVKNKVVIYTSLEDYRVVRLKQLFEENLMDVNIELEYYNTGNHVAKLLAEGINTNCDITLSLDYGYLQKLSNAGLLADVSNYKNDKFIEETDVSNDYIIQEINSCSVAINVDYFRRNELNEPKSYNDLLSEEYKGLISMPNPITSGTGYGFLKALVNSWGEDSAFDYFNKLSKNIVEFTSSGNGPLNLLRQNEVAIGFGMTAAIVTTINEGYNLKILNFKEGFPYTYIGIGMIKNKDKNDDVRKVFRFLIDTFNRINNDEFFPEQIYKDYIPTIKNYPKNIKYANMSNNTIEEKDRLLEKWSTLIE